MTEQITPIEVSRTLPKPEFDAGFFTINYFSTDPNGFNVETDQSLPRRDGTPPSDLALTQEQRSELRRGMGNEAFFTLPKDFPQDQKPMVRTMFQLIDEVATMKQAGQEDEEYQKKRAALQEIREALRPLFKEFKLTEQLGVKVGVRNMKREGNTLTMDVRPISYPLYAVGASPEESTETLDLSAVTGTAAVLITSDNKIILQHRSSKNSPYGDMPGASFAGMLDAVLLRERDGQTGEIKKRTGLIEPVDDTYIKNSSASERQQEIALTNDDLTDFRIVGAARDHVREHDEFLLLAKTSLTAKEVAQKAKDAPRSRNSKKLDEHGDFHFEENFITIDATPQAIETLLTEVKCPLPPTHAAAFVATGYNMMLEQDGIDAANIWRDKMQGKIKQNYEEMNSMVSEYYKNFPVELSNNKPGKPQRNPSGYEPYYSPQEQGLPHLGAELIRTELLA